MTVDYVRPCVNDLIFQLYARPVHPELFETLAIRRIERPDYLLTLQITKTGHVITWDTEDICLTEMTAAWGQELPQKRRLLHYRLRGEHSSRVDCAHGVVYQMSFQVETMQPEIFLHMHDEILADGERGGLLHNFQPNHRLAVAPVSLIAAETKPDYLLVSTFHTFPAENTIIKSQSLIEKKS